MEVPFANLKSAFDKSIVKLVNEFGQQADAIVEKVTLALSQGEAVPQINQLGQWLVNIDKFLPEGQGERDAVLEMLRQKAYAAGFDLVKFKGGTEYSAANGAEYAICLKPTDQVAPSGQEPPKNLVFYCKGCGKWGMNARALRDCCESPLINAISLDEGDAETVKWAAKAPAADRDKFDFLEFIGQQPLKPSQRK